MRTDILSLAIAAIFAAILITASVYDIRYRRIPNWTVIALAVLFVPATLMGHTLSTWPWSLAAFGIALAGSGVLYLIGGVGAGDSKLFSVTALFAGLAHLFMLSIATVLAGGLLAIGLLILRPKSAFRSLTARGRAEGGSRGVPYGVAIALGGLLCAALMAYPQLFAPAPAPAALAP